MIVNPDFEPLKYVLQCIHTYTSTKTNSHHPAAVIGDGILVVIRLQVRLLGTDRRETEDNTQDLLNSVEISVSWNFDCH